MSLDTIKTHEEFKSQLTLFVGTHAQIWKLLTNLTKAAIEQYHHQDHDTSWLVDLENAILVMEGGKQYQQAFEKAVSLTTNVKFRGDEQDPTKPVTAITRGNKPEDWSTVLESMARDGLQKWGKVAKAGGKGTIARLNNDFERKARSEQTSSGTVTHLEATDSGKKLVEAAQTMDAITDEAQKKLAEQIMDQAKAQVQAVAEGKDVHIEPSGTPAFSHLTGDRLDRMVKLMNDIDKMAEAAETNPRMAEKLDTLLTTTETVVTPAAAAALAIVSGGDVPKKYAVRAAS